jgi:hypothetical protein
MYHVFIQQGYYYTLAYPQFTHIWLQGSIFWSKNDTPPPFLKMVIFSHSHDKSFLWNYLLCPFFALILPYFAFILPFYFPFSLFLSPFFLFFPFLCFSLTFPHNSLPLALADISLPPGGGGYFPTYRSLFDYLLDKSTSSGLMLTVW